VDADHLATGGEYRPTTSGGKWRSIMVESAKIRMTAVQRRRQRCWSEAARPSTRCWVVTAVPTIRSTRGWKPTILLDGIREQTDQCMVLKLWPRRALSQSSQRRQQADGGFRAVCQGLTDYALRARTAGRSAGVGRRNALAGIVTTVTVLPVMSKNSTE